MRATNLNFGFLAFLFLLGWGGPLGAQDLLFSGSLRHVSAFRFEALDLPINTQTLDLTLSGQQEEAAFLVNGSVQVLSPENLAWGIREAYVDLFLPLGDVRIGKQAVPWGLAEGAFITDLVSPQDLRNFILADFKEIRQGIPAVKVTHYLGDFTLEGVWLPWFQPAILPEAGSLWHTPAMPVMSALPIPPLLAENSEFFLRLNYFGSALSAEVMGGYAWDDNPVASGSPLAPAFSFERFGVVGGNFSATLPFAVLRGEGALYLDKSFTTLQSGLPPSLVLWKGQQLQALAGLDWSLLGADFSVQYINQTILDPVDSLKAPELQQTLTFRARDSFFSDSLALSFFAYMSLDTFDMLLRPALLWSVADGVEAELRGEVFLGEEEGRFGQYAENTLLSLMVKWYF